MRPRSVPRIFHLSCHVDVHTTCHMIQTNLFQQHCTMRTSDQKQNKRFDTESGVRQVLAKPHTLSLSRTLSLTHSCFSFGRGLRTGSRSFLLVPCLLFSVSLSLCLSLSLFRFLWTRNGGPQTGSRQKQHSTPVRITVTISTIMRTGRRSTCNLLFSNRLHQENMAKILSRL